MTNQDFHVDSLKARITDAEDRLREARERWYDALPALPIQDVCPVCGADWTDFGVLQRVEHGYQRWTNGDIQVVDDDENARFVHWSTDGWDDMSEDSEFEYVQCNPFNGGCGACFKIPDSEEWD